MPNTKKQKVALITGASSGIGRDTALALAAAGWRVAVAARRVERLSTLADQIDPDGQSAFAVSLDLGSSESIYACVAAVVKKFGYIDAVVHNAGFTQPAPIATSSDELLRQTFDTNVIGPTQLSREVIQHWQSCGRFGDFFFVSSEQVRHELPHLVHYGASKVALEFVARGIQTELRKQGCRCIVMQVGATDTEFRSHFNIDDALAMVQAWEEVGIPIPMGHRINSSEVADTITFALNIPRHLVLDRIDMLPTGIAE